MHQRKFSDSSLETPYTNKYYPQQQLLLCLNRHFKPFETLNMAENSTHQPSFPKEKEPWFLSLGWKGTREEMINF